jgi:hypothetical protein
MATRRFTKNNYVSPHPVLLDADIDCFNHPDAGPALMRAAAKYPEDPPSDTNSARFFFCFFVLFWGAYRIFSFGGLSIWRAVVFALER